MSNNSDWIVEDEKVKIGTEWKDEKQLKKSFAFELLATIAFAMLSVYAFTINLFLCVVMVVMTIACVFVMLGTTHALKALGSKINLKPNLKEGAQNFKSKMEPKAAVEPIPLFEATLVKTTSKDRQEVLEKLVDEEVLLINENFLVSTKDGVEVGEVSKTNITKIEKFSDENDDVKEYKCKVVGVEKNNSNKNVVKVEVLAIK